MANMTTLNAALNDFISVVNKVRDAGVSATIDLPTIVFCGKQSAGKSSLIESMSGVNLPRASGTCTRTPTEVRLTNTPAGSKWQCQIRLRYEEDEHKSQIEVPFESPIYDRDFVAAAISRAQATLLGATGESQEVLSSGQGKMQFSRNVICVDIRGPECGDLALIDLPGLIETTEHPEDRVFINVVRSMVLSYISKPNSIIAMTISCKDDMENQAIKTLAAQVDPMGHRTIGVLTKPDTVEAGCHDQYFDVLTGKRFPLRLGYFVVKNPSQQELNEGISRSQAKLREKQFFSTQPPWCNVDTTMRNVGADLLTRKLSELLREKIRSEMPKMCSTVCSELQLVTNQLAELGMGIDARNVHATLLKIICTFEQEVIACVEADNEAKGLYKMVLANYKDFITTLQRERPLFAISSAPQPDPLRIVEELTTMIVPIGSAGLTFEDVADIIRNETGRNIVENMSYEPVRLLVKEFVKTWDLPAYHCMKEVRNAFESVIQRLAERRFNHYTTLMELVSHALISSLDKIERETSDRIRHLFDMENRMPFTMCAQHMWNLRRVNSRSLWQHYIANLQLTMPDIAQAKSEEIIGLLNALESDMPDQEIPPWMQQVDVASMRETIKVMSSVMAYFSIATKRFGDNVPMAIDSLLLRGFGARVREALCEQLGLFTKQPIELCDLFVQNPETVRKKEELATKEERLKKAWDLLRPYASAAQRAGNYSQPTIIVVTEQPSFQQSHTPTPSRYRSNPEEKHNDQPGSGAPGFGGIPSRPQSGSHSGSHSGTQYGGTTQFDASPATPSFHSQHVGGQQQQADANSVSGLPFGPHTVPARTHTESSRGLSTHTVHIPPANRRGRPPMPSSRMNGHGGNNNGMPGAPRSNGNRPRHGGNGDNYDGMSAGLPPPRDESSVSSISSMSRSRSRPASPRSNGKAASSPANDKRRKKSFFKK